MKKFLWLVSLALLAMLVLGGCATIGSDGNQFITGGEYMLRSGETFNGDLSVIGGNTTLEQGSRVNGNLYVIGGNTDARGEINGSIWLLGGNVDLGPNSLVRGDVTINSGNVSRAPGAQITGKWNSGQVFQGPAIVPVLTLTPMLLLGWLLMRSLVLAALAAVIVLLSPEALKRTARAIVQQPVGAGLIGLVIMVLTPIVLLLFAVTLIGIPVTILGALAAVIAVTFGWMALGVEVGQRLGGTFNLKMEPVLRAALGTFVLVIVMGAVDMIPFLGGVITFIVSALALGGVVLTRFGRRVYSPPSNVAAPPTLPQSTSA